MPHPDEGMIHAWLDGELSPDEAARVSTLVEQDPEWRAAAAEARGLIAASSRIVGALDAVPGGVVPAKAPVARRPYGVRPWVGIAAGLVLVAGTAYVIRDTTDAAFRPGIPTASEVAPTASTPPSPMPAPPPATSEAEAGERPSAPLTAPASPAVAAGSGARDAADAVPPTPSALGTVSGVAVRSAKSADADPLNPQVRRAEEALREQAKAAATASVARAEEQRTAPTAAAQRLRTDTDRTADGAPTIAPAPAPARVPQSAALAEQTAIPSPLRVLEGCWLATAPEALARMHRDLLIVRFVGDSLELRITPTETVVVLRDGDSLRGGLTARRTECPATP